VFLCDVVMANFKRKEQTVEERITTRLRRIGYLSRYEKPTTHTIEKVIINIANSNPDVLRVIGEPLVYEFMDRRQNVSK